MGIADAFHDLEADFELLGEWDERYQHVIDLGRGLPPLSDAERSDDNRVRGCASPVWLVSKPNADGTINYRADSEARIVRGLIAILLQIYSDRAPAEILAFDAKGAFERLGLPSALSMQRSNGLFSMVERIRRDAAAAAEPAA